MIIEELIYFPHLNKGGQLYDRKDDLKKNLLDSGE